MYCLKCGKELKDGANICDCCGAQIPNRSTAYGFNNSKNEIISEVDINQKKQKTDAKSKPIRIIFFSLSVVVFVLAFISAGFVSSGGLDIASIQSVGGKTLEEAYYQYSGAVYSGYAMFIRTAGVFFSAVLAYFGMKG